MSDRVLKLAVAKFGCIGATPLLDIILDERASRKDLEVRAFSSGAKLDLDSCTTIVQQIINYSPELILIVSPNAALPGPTAARESLSDANIPTISICDGASKKAFIGKDAAGKKITTVATGQGFIILPADAMIGARLEFLDPTEMTLFNADVIKVLSITGVIRCLQMELGRVITDLKAGNTPEMPKLVAEAEQVVESAGFSNPYAAAKAIAALLMSESVAKMTTRACFKEKDPQVYIPLVAAGHELMRAAAQLADEAREIEKYSDSVQRTPHTSSGEIKYKTKLAEKPV